MPRIKLIVSIVIFSILLSVTSVFKTQTRVIEKKIYKSERKIQTIEKDLYETELDYFYHSSPSNLAKKVEELALIEYSPVDFSRIYLNYVDFTNAQKKITILKEKNEKKKNTQRF
jgi:hypothetical protein